MIIHIVLLQLKPETSGEAIEAVLEQIKALQQKVPGILEVQAGKNTNPYGLGYEYGFVMHFVDAHHLKVYSPHPEHKAVSSQLRQLCSSILNFDLPQG